MPSTARTSLPVCESCGAKANRMDSRFCDFCGAELPQVISEAPQGPGGQSVNLEGRFQALAEHPEAKRFAGFTPEDAGKAHPAAVAFGGIFLVVWLGIGSVIIAGFAAMAGPMVLFPIAIVAFGTIAMLAQAGKYQKFRSAPIKQHHALVVDERINVSGEGEDSRARTTNFTTLEYPDGSRAEVKTISAAAGQACPGDVGVAYIRGGVLVYFGRVPV